MAPTKKAAPTAKKASGARPTFLSMIQVSLIHFGGYGISKSFTLSSNLVILSGRAGESLLSLVMAALLAPLEASRSQSPTIKPLTRCLFTRREKEASSLVILPSHHITTSVHAWSLSSRTGPSSILSDACFAVSGGKLAW
jgi:hypothetical protein